MTTKEFYARHVGARVRVKIIYAPQGIILDSKPYARIVGFGEGSHILIEFEDEELRNRSITYDRGNPTVCEMLDGIERSWFVFFSQFEFVDEPKPQSLPRKSKCKYCSSLGFKSKNLFVCSNSKCRKSRRDIRKQFKPPVYPKRSVDNYVYCPKCNEVAFSLTSYRDARCPNNHIWEHKWVEGDKLRQYNTIWIMRDGSFCLQGL